MTAASRRIFSTATARTAPPRAATFSSAPTGFIRPCARRFIPMNARHVGTDPCCGAAHPMYPVGSNGASQAILDARALADRLRTAEHPMHALAMYEQERLPMTALVVQMNRRGGLEGVIDTVEERAPEGFSNVEDVLP